jgi:uncharacterized protein (DUF305 family)
VPGTVPAVVAPMKKIWLLTVCVACTTPAPRPLPPGGDESSFLADNDRAMQRMMAAMMIRPSGDIDADFVGMMSPHHQGAVDMAMLELRYGHNESLKRLAQEIIVTQGDEMRAMTLAIAGAK